MVYSDIFPKQVLPLYLASGLYFYKLDAVDAGNSANSFAQTRKMILVK